MSIPCDKTFMLVLSLRSSVRVKVKYQGHSFRKNGHFGGIGVSQTHLVHFCFISTYSPDDVTSPEVFGGRHVTITLTDTSAVNSPHSIDRQIHPALDRPNSPSSQGTWPLKRSQRWVIEHAEYKCCDRVDSLLEMIHVTEKQKERVVLPISCFILCKKYIANDIWEHS